MTGLLRICNIFPSGLIPVLCFAGMLLYFYSKNGNEKILIFIAILVSLALCMPLINRGMIYDELHLATHYVLRPDFWPTLINYEPMKDHIGYTILAYCSYNIFGKADWVFRLPALLFGVANIAVFWYLTRKIWGAPFAFMAALLMAFSPPNIIWSSSARGYSALIFFSFF